jgi:hypothetical protein
VPTSALFLPPTSPKSPPSSSTPSPEPSDASPPAPETGGWFGRAGGSGRDERPGSGDTRSTGDDIPVNPISKRGIRTVCEQSIKTLSGLVASFIATEDERQAEPDLWRADEDDVEAISAPAARIIWRRLPEDAKGSDPIDILHMALGVAGYVGKNMAVRRRLRKQAELSFDDQDRAA